MSRCRVEHVAAWQCSCCGPAVGLASGAFQVRLCRQGQRAWGRAVHALKASSRDSSGSGLSCMSVQLTAQPAHSAPSLWPQHLFAGAPLTLMPEACAGVQHQRQALGRADQRGPPAGPEAEGGGGPQALQRRPPCGGCHRPAVPGDCSCSDSPSAPCSVLSMLIAAVWGWELGLGWCARPLRPCACRCEIGMCAVRGMAWPAF